VISRRRAAYFASRSNSSLSRSWRFRPGDRLERGSALDTTGADWNSMSARKTSRLNLRVAPADDALLRQAAELLGESISEFLVESARERAERLVADRTRFVLADEQWSAFCAALDRPAEVKPELRDLFGRSRPE